MRGFIVSVIAMVAIIVFFFVGMFAQAPALSMAGFCLGPFITFALGWTASRAFAGQRLAWVKVQPEPERQPRAVGQQRAVLRKAGRMEDGI